MVPLKRGGSQSNFVQKVRFNYQRNRKSKRGIAAAFTPGLLKNNTNDESARSNLLKHYHDVVNQCGFREGTCTKRTAPPYWRVSLNPSSSFEVQINFDRDMNIIKVSERPLNWVHGTVLDGSKQQFNGSLRTKPDVRILMSTEEKVQLGSDLYRCCFPGGNVPILIKDDKPILPTFVDGKHATKKNFVSMVRNVKSTELFTNGDCDACIVNGVLYFGKDLTMTRSFCELSLYFDTEPLRNVIRNDLNGEELESFSRKLFNISNRIKEKLDDALCPDQ